MPASDANRAIGMSASAVLGHLAARQTRTRGSMDGELRVQVRCKNHGVDQEDSVWRRVVGADFRYDDRAVFFDAGVGSKFRRVAPRVAVSNLELT